MSLVFDLRPVHGHFEEASSETIRHWIENLETGYYLAGTVVGPHPCPTMVREFQAVIGRETRRQAVERWGGRPDMLVACALGFFHEFVEEEGVRLIGVEAAGFGLDSGKHAATLARGEVGIYHRALSYLLQDSKGQILGIGHSLRTKHHLSHKFSYCMYKILNIINI
ncbi:hypothetical protein SAY86_030389 [Trapa natans]|uniref:Uncharacterized protein n=1 Tax=Trapa natans TaxID=22666 RepID=A0AAN7RIE1_TRANT|nr:hypothetical protein SAY86_030389 [Trapa natans]